MKILNDNINLLIVLLFGSLAFITVTKGRWSDKIKPADVYNSSRIHLSKNTSIDPSYSIEPLDQTFTLEGTLDIVTDSISLDSLLISLTEIDDKNGSQNRQIAIKTEIQGSHTPIRETFNFKNPGSHRFIVAFSSRESSGDVLMASVELKKTKNFELSARNSSDIIIVLYPALWVAFGVLLLVKITNLIRDDDPDKKSDKEEDNQEEGYL